MNLLIEKLNYLLAPPQKGLLFIAGLIFTGYGTMGVLSKKIPIWYHGLSQLVIGRRAVVWGLVYFFVGAVILIVVARI